MLKGNFKRKKLLLLFFVLCLTLTFSPVNAFADDPINSYDTVRSFDNAENHRTSQAIEAPFLYASPLPFCNCLIKNSTTITEIRGFL